MAGTTNNIRLPDGTTVTVPSWASEETMRTLANEVRKRGNTDARIQRAIEQVGFDASQFEDALKALDRAIKKAADAEEQSAKKVKETLKTQGKAIAGHLQNTDKPLTATAGILNSIVDSAGGIGASFLKGNKFVESLAGSLGGLGDAAKVAGATFVTWVGWNAAKIEQFAEVQKSMIDSGAIMFNTVSAFTNLRSRAMNSGVSYTQFAEVISENGFAMKMLGGSVSDGSELFMQMIEGPDGLFKLSDKFGDFGLTHDQMMKVYAQYIGTQARSGFVKRGQQDVEQKLTAGFNKLMLETTAYANLTGTTRGELLAARLAGMEDVHRGIALSKMGEKYPEVAKQGAAVLEKLDMYKAMSTDAAFKSQIEQIQNAIILEMSAKPNAPDLMDIRNQIANDSAFLATLKESGVDLIINRIGKGEDITQELENAFRNVSEYDKKATAHFTLVSDGASETAKQMYTFSNGMNNLNIKLGDMEKELNGRTIEQYMQDLARNMQEANQSGVALSDMTRDFLVAQDLITVDLQKAGDYLGEFTSILTKTADWMMRVTTGNTPGALPQPTDTPDKPEGMSDPNAEEWWKKVYYPTTQGVHPMSNWVDNRQGTTYHKDIMFGGFNPAILAGKTEGVGKQIFDFYASQIRDEGKTPQDATKSTYQQFGHSAISSVMPTFNVTMNYSKVNDGNVTPVSKEEYDAAQAPVFTSTENALADMFKEIGGITATMNDPGAAQFAMRQDLQILYANAGLKDTDGDQDLTIKDARETLQSKETMAALLEGFRNMVVKYRQAKETENTREQ